MKKESTGPNYLAIVFQTAIPMMLASLLHVSQQFVNTYFMGHDSFASIYIFSLFLPFSFLLIAITESVSISHQVVVAKRLGEGTAEYTTPVAVSLTAVGMLFVLLTAGALYLTGPLLSDLFNVPLEHRGAFIHFSMAMVIASAILIPARVLNGALRGLGRVGIAFWVAAINTVLFVGFVYYFCKRLGWGLDGIVYATALDGILFTLSAAAVLFKLGYLRLNLGIFRPHPQAFIFLKIVGLPIFLSYILIFGSTFFFNRIVSDFGEVALAGFGIAYRIQTFVILPAIAFGSAVAILMNHRLGGKQPAEAYRVFRSGLAAIFGTYLVIAVGVYLLRVPLIGLFTDDAATQEHGVRFLSTVALSYSWMGVLLSVLVLLEETGDGLRAFVLNLTYFTLIVVVGWVLTSQLGELVWFYRAFAIFNCLGLGVIYRESKRLRNKYLVSLG